MYPFRISYSTLVYITKVFPVIDITLSTVYEVYVSFRKTKDQGTGNGDDYGSHLDGAYNSSNLRFLVLK